MEKFLYHRKLFVLLPFFCLLLLCCSNAGDIPKIVNMDVSIQNREMTPKNISVKEDDTLTLNIISDESGTIHIHGYLIEQKIEKNEETKLRFDTGATGQFNIAFHIGEADLSNGEHQHQNDGHSEGAEEVEEVILGSLKVYPR